jgi:hypothetical protein
MSYKRCKTSSKNVDMADAMSVGRTVLCEEQTMYGNIGRGNQERKDLYSAIN